MKLEYVKWLDSCSPDMNGWIAEDEISEGVMEIETVGFVLTEDERSVTYASQITDEGSNQVAGVISIPKCAIQKRKKLKKP